MQLACTQKMQLCLFAVRKGKKTAMRKTHNGHFNIIFDVIASETRPEISTKIAQTFLARAGFPVCPRYRKRRMQYTPLTSTCTKPVHHCPVPLFCVLRFRPVSLLGPMLVQNCLIPVLTLLRPYTLGPRPARSVKLVRAGVGWLRCDCGSGRLCCERCY